MLVKKVKVENFKRFERLEVELRWFDCLVGPNNSGKTTLLQALALFDFCVHHCLSARNGAIDIKRRTIAPDEFYVLPVADPVDLWTDRKTQAGNKHKIVTVTIDFNSGHSVTAAVDLNYNRFGVSIQSDDESQPWLRELKGLGIAYLPVFSTFLPQEERRTRIVIEDELSRGRVHGVIRNLLLDLKDQSRDGDLVEILRRIFPDLRDMTIEFDAANDRYISVTYNEEGRPKAFDIFSAGSGFQQFVYLFGFILLRQPSVILLDEPDVHLHGGLQHTLLAELGRLVAQGKQVLFATHSREMIARMSPEEILCLEPGGTKRLSVAYDVYDTLDRLGSIDLTQLPVIQAYRRVVVVEDRTDRDLLAVFCTKVLGAPAWHQVERRLAYCFAKGNPCKQDMPRLRAQLQQMVGLEGQPLEMFVVADRDYHPDPDQLRQQLAADRIRWHVWQRVEIENYLLSLAALTRVLGEPAAQCTLEEPLLRAELDRLVEESRDAANDRLVKAFQELRSARGEKWDASTMSRMAREYLKDHWTHDKLALADAKEAVLPGIKRWMQAVAKRQFSDKALAEAMRSEELPDEVHTLARRLAEFVGVSL